MWSPGDDSGVLYTWVEWIRTGDFLAEVGLLADDTIRYVLPLSFIRPLSHDSRLQNTPSLSTAPPLSSHRLRLRIQITAVRSLFLSMRNMSLAAQGHTRSRALVRPCLLQGLFG